MNTENCNYGIIIIVFPLWPIQHLVPNPVRMEGPAQLLTLVPVMWGGQECSVKQVGERVSGEAISLPKVL